VAVRAESWRKTRNLYHHLGPQHPYSPSCMYSTLSHFDNFGTGSTFIYDFFYAIYHEARSPICITTMTWSIWNAFVPLLVFLYYILLDPF
jgi:hypothetical protein